MWVESCFKVELPQDFQLQVNRWRDWKEAWRNQRPTIPDKELQQLAHLPLRLEQHCHRRRLHQLQDLHRPSQGGTLEHVIFGFNLLSRAPSSSGIVQIVLLSLLVGSSEQETAGIVDKKQQQQ